MCGQKDFHFIFAKSQRATIKWWPIKIFSSSSSSLFFKSPTQSNPHETSPCTSHENSDEKTFFVFWLFGNSRRKSCDLAERKTINGWLLREKCFQKITKRHANYINLHAYESMRSCVYNLIKDIFNFWHHLIVNLISLKWFFVFHIFFSVVIKLKILSHNGVL